MTLRVIGAGFGRTGTLSMKGALEHLGLGPCYHMLEIMNRPENADAWYNAAQSGKADWDQILSGYHSTVDWPACHYWQTLAAHFPDAKVTLTVRDEEAWWQSMSKTILRNFQDGDEVVDPARISMRRMTRDLIVERVFGGILDDRDHVLTAYRRNIEAVRAGLPKERLLVFDVAEGWAPLCAFLDLPVPAAPFPRTNTTLDFLDRMAERKAQKD
ncbi:MAG: sulfotransferase family protein [Alphaproteobacteria bacterium]|nr:sulfotransferase family protein [Alphaproteobacteria bacterium]